MDARSIRGEGGSKWRQRLLEFDGWIDSTLHDAGRGAGAGYERVVAVMSRFRAEGISRCFAEAASESLTLGVAGMLVLLAFAVPAFDAISKDWRTQSDFSVTFLDRYGNVIGKRGILQDDSVQLEDLPDHLVKAVLATEDRRFFEHFGIDVFGTFRALRENARAGGVVQGGSSITQQLAKNLFLSNERTLQRKIKEAYLALWLEANLTKHEILKLYMDRAYMGGGTFGVGAASEFYFGKSPQDLDLAESAMLAGLFKAPTKYAPHINLPAARARANEVLTNMVQAGFVTEGQVVGARRRPATAIERSQLASPDYFLDWAFEEVKQHVDGREKVLIARTTIDMRLQKAAEAALESTLRESGEAYNVGQGALVSMDLDGSVRAMVGGRDYGASTFNRAVNALRQPGSSFKPYVYAVAVENGYTPESKVLDAPVSIGNWSPQNYGRSYKGRLTLRSALTQSLNTVAVRLSIEFGRQPIADMAARLGVKTPLVVTRSLALGTSELTVLDQATAYSVFANGGYRTHPRAIVDVRTPDGQMVYDAAASAPPRQRVLSEEAVVSMVDMMHSVVEQGTARRARIPGINVAGKTGTTNAYRDAWFVGFTGNFSTAVWLGNDNFTPTKRLTGGILPAETWQKYMRVAMAYEEVKPLPGLPPAPPAPDKDLVADAEGGDQLIDAGASARLAPETSDALGRLEERFRTVIDGAPVRQAALDAGETIQP
ncbi:MAG TPA: PBP1A family penicillin-binding protein [Afifellaceae bacterium]|nr:PBP1A family penicillin-binding protein [Afifellaceae bacterium]